MGYFCDYCSLSKEVFAREFAFVNGGYDGYSWDALFLLNGSHRFLTLFAFYVGFLTIENLYGDGRRGTLVHPDACSKKNNIFGWRFIYRGPVEVVGQHLKDLVKIIIEQLSDMPAEFHSLHPEVRHGYACVDKHGLPFVLSALYPQPAEATEDAAMAEAESNAEDEAVEDRKGKAAAEEEEEEPESEEEEEDYEPLDEVIREDGEAIINFMVRVHCVAAAVFVVY